MFLDFFEKKTEDVIKNFNMSESQEPVVEYTVPEIKLSCFHQVDVNTVKSITQKVKFTYCANDPLPMSDIKRSENFSDLLKTLTDMVNVSIDNNVFPLSEKRAIVKPIVKGKLDPQSLNSFRPVSNLTFLSKILEKVILDQLMDHLQLVNVLPDNQSAYRRLYSTETTLCSVVNNLLVHMDEGKCSVLILLDLSAAFDTVVHNVLLQDCKNIGIEGDALKYLRSYLENRSYCVQIGTSFSNTRHLQRGVPQGSVLDPILFCVYTSELSHVYLESMGLTLNCMLMIHSFI